MELLVGIIIIIAIVLVVYVLNTLGKKVLNKVDLVVDFLGGLTGSKPVDKHHAGQHDDHSNVKLSQGYAVAY